MICTHKVFYTFTLLVWCVSNEPFVIGNEENFTQSTTSFAIETNGTNGTNGTEEPPQHTTLFKPKFQIISITNMDFEKEGMKDSRNLNGKIVGFSGMAMSRCAEECFRKANCESVNFKLDTMECELLKSGNEPAVASEGWTFFKGIDWLQNISNTCKKDSCTGNARCVDISDSEHVCIITHCDRPQDIKGAKISQIFDDFEVGKSIRYSCEPSVKHSGNAEITCKTDGTWTHTAFQCLCVEPPTVTGVNLGSGRSVGTELKYTCKDLLVTFGSTKSITCQSNGAWSPSSVDVYCECPSDPTASHGTYFTSANGRRVGRTWYLSCQSHYYDGCSYCVGHGSYSYTTCQSDGKWTYMDYYCA